MLSAIKLCRATRWLQLGHDGSTIVDKDTTSASIVVQYGDGKLEKIILSSSFLCEDKSAQATYEGIVSLVDRIKVRYLGQSQAMSKIVLSVSKPVSGHLGRP